MTAATVTTNRAPTKEEIREAVEERSIYQSAGATVPRGGETPLLAALRGIAEDYSDPIADAGRAVHRGDFSDPTADTGLWRDLRRSEADELVEIVDLACMRAAIAAERVIVEELVAAGLRFAELHPDAPRAKVTP